jgi:hypothetical protein
VKYAWITQHRDLYPIVLLCELLAVSKAGYYDWLRREPSPRAQRSQRIHAAVRAVHAESQAIYGSFKIARELARRDDLESARKKRGQGSIVDARGGMLPPNEAKQEFNSHAEPGPCPVSNFLRVRRSAMRLFDSAER